MFVRAILIAFLSVGIAGSASARTPTPTATPTPAPPAATPTPPQLAVFGVIPWVNAQNQAREVTAKIGQTLCATGVPNTGAVRGIFGLSVPSEEALPGCGREGAIVTFFVDGEQAPQTAIWHPGGFQLLHAIIGPPFAHFYVVVHGEVPQTFGLDGRLVPYVGDKVCGDINVVYSNEQEAGCGVEGSQITFKILDGQGNILAVANQKATWHAWDGNSDARRLDLTFGPATVITMPGTGTRDASPGEGSGWARLSVLLGFVGLAGAGFGLALRKRAMTR